MNSRATSYAKSWLLQVASFPGPPHHGIHPLPERTMNPTHRKTYAAPDLVKHGNAVERTRGGYGYYVEYWFWRRYPNWELLL